MSNGRMTLVKTKFLSRLAILVFCFFTGLLGASQTTFATDSTLTITLSENAVTANVAPMATPSGTFIESNGMTVGVSTDHISGYTLSIKASDSTTPGRLKNGNSYLQSIANETTLNNFKNADLSNSDLATSLGLSDCAQITESSNCKGIWGYKPNYLYNATMDTTDANDLFLPTPGTAGQAIAKTSGPNQTPNEYTITLGAKVSPLATIGSYTNTFVLMAVGNNIPYTIEFSENTVENMPVNILDGSTSGTTATIPSGTTNTPTRPGYKFAGWCDQATTKSGNSDTCATGHSHQPGDTISLNQTGANNIKLYAIWQEICAGYTTMQSLSSSNIGTLLPNVGSTATVCDVRDETKYIIGKLADNKYWMLDNLALDLTTVSLNDLKGNTNASDEVLTYLKNGGGSGQYPANGVIAKTSNSGSWTNSYTDPYIATGYISTVPQDNNDPLKTETSNGNWKIGVYYNYCAASAGSYCYSTSNAPTDSQNGVRNIDADICPKGWRLPTGNSNGEFKTLSNAVTGSTSNPSTSNNGYSPFRTALRLPLSGDFGDGSAYDQGSDGHWWSSTRNNYYSMYGLRAYTSSIYPANYSIRYFGLPVRCVLGS